MAHIQKSSEAAIGSKGISIASINYIELTDFMAFSGHRKIVFGDSTVIIGDNGAGKSSIFEAIFISLGESGRNKNRLEKYINKDVIETGGKCEIVLYVTLTSGVDMKIETVISTEGKRLEKTVTVYHETPEIYKNQQAINYLREYNFDVFAQIAFIKQGETGLISDSPSQTFKNVRNVLKSDFWAEHEAVAADSKLFKSESDGILASISECDGSITSMDRLIGSIEEKIRLLSNVEGLTPDEVNKHIEELNEESAKIKIEYENTSSASQKLIDAEKVVRSYKSNIDSAKGQISQSDSIVSSAKNELTKYEDALKLISITKSIDEVTEELKKNTELLSDITAKRSEAIADLKYYTSRFEAIKGGKCPTCGSVFASNDSEAAKAKVDEINKSYEELTSSLSNINETTRQLNADISSIKDAEHKKELYEQQIKTLNEKITLAEDHKKQNTDFIEQQTELLSKAEAERDEIAKSTNNGKSSELYQKLQDLANEVSEYSNKLTKISQLAEQKSTLTQCNETKAEATSKKSKLEKELEAVAVKMQLSEEAKDLFANKLPSFFLNNLVLDKITASMTEIVSKFGYDYVKCELTEDGDGLEFSLCEDRFEIPMSELSNFEKALMQFSIKVAFADLLGVSVVCFDEPDAAASESNELSMAERLLDLTKSHQLLVITHSSSTKGLLVANGAGVECIVKESNCVEEEEEDEL